jgi:hypothetical protein
MFSLVPPDVTETVVDPVLDVLTEVGVPKVEAGTVALAGLGALAGPVADRAGGSVWYAPLSHEEPRGVPTSSVVGQASGVVTPSPIAGLPARGASTARPAPISSASGESRGSAPVRSLVTVLRKHVPSLSMLPPTSVEPALSVAFA